MSANEKDVSNKIPQAQPIHQQSIFLQSSPVTISLTWKGDTKFLSGQLQSVEVLVNKVVRFSALVPESGDRDTFEPIRLTLINKETQQAIDALRINKFETLKNVTLQTITKFSDDVLNDLSKLGPMVGVPCLRYYATSATSAVPFPLIDLQPGAHYHLELEHVVRQKHNKNGGSADLCHEIQARLARYTPSVADKNKLAERLCALLEPTFIFGVDIYKLTGQTTKQPETVDRKQYCREFIDNMNALIFEKLHHAPDDLQLLNIFRSGKEALLTQLIAGILTRQYPGTPADCINDNALESSEAIYQANSQNAMHP